MSLPHPGWLRPEIRGESVQSSHRETAWTLCRTSGAVLTWRGGARECSNPHGCGVTSVPGAGSMRNIQPCQGQTWALAHCKPLSDNPRDWSCASLGSGGCCGDAASTKGDSRGENSRKRQHLLHQDAQCRGCGGDPLYLNCKVVREADSQGLVQAWHSMAFFISHWHPKKQLDMFPPFVSQGRVFVFLLPPCASGP